MDLFKNNLEALPKKPEELVAGPSPSTSEWPSLRASQVSKELSLLAGSIPPGQRRPAGSATPVSWSVIKKKNGTIWKGQSPYFKGIEILPIPELVTEVEPKTLSYIIRRLAGI